MTHPTIRERFDLRAAAPRIPSLLVGLVVFGLGIALMVEAGLGLGPWEALNQGVARQLGIEIGTASVLLGIPILALWWPLGERPGIGTLLNVILIGTSTNAALALLPTVPIYLATDLGPGPRDGLMTGVHHRFGWSIRRARTAIEIAVLVVGWALGGVIGLGTVLFALGIGPLIQVALRVFDREGRVGRRRLARLGSEGAVGE
jgi:uncharacterized membrane protein YczE